MQTKHLCILIHIWTKDEVGAPFNRFKPSSKIFYRPFQGGTSFVDLLCFFCLVFAMPLYMSIYMCLVVTCWERALVCGVLLWVCYFPIGILGQVWYLIVSIPYLCTLTYMYFQKCKNQLFEEIKRFDCNFYWIEFLAIADPSSRLEKHQILDILFMTYFLWFFKKNINFCIFRYFWKSSAAPTKVIVCVWFNVTMLEQTQYSLISPFSNDIFSN